jgi:hypothetical protein
MAIRISDHICRRFIERFNPGLSAVTDEHRRLMIARRALNSILEDSIYVSDNTDGVLLYNKSLKANIIVRNSTFITIYSKNQKRNRERDNGR